MSTTKKSQSIGSRTKTCAQKEVDKLKRIHAQVVINPIFVDAIPLAGSDTYWSTKLLLASRGRFPKNFFLRKNTIRFKTPKRDIESQYLGITPVEVYESFTGFLRKYGHFDSDNDIQATKNMLIEVEEKKSHRGVAAIEIHEYLNLCKDSWGLTEEVFQSYKESVFTLVRLQGKKCISYHSDGEIEKFNGVIRDKRTGLYTVSPKVLSTFLVPKQLSKNTLKAKPIVWTHYRSKEEDFEEVIIKLEKGRKNIHLNDILDMRVLNVT
jgi:hypothetical protein